MTVIGAGKMAESILDAVAAEVGDLAGDLSCTGAW
jgi:hypothetical protein